MGGWRFADLDGFEEKNTQGMALFVPQSWDSPVPGLSCSQGHSEAFLLLQLLFPAGLSLLSPLPGTNQPIPTAWQAQGWILLSSGGVWGVGAAPGWAQSATHPIQTLPKPFLQGDSDTGAECHKKELLRSSCHLKYTHSGCCPAFVGSQASLYSLELSHFHSQCDSEPLFHTQ